MQRTGNSIAVRDFGGRALLVLAVATFSACVAEVNEEPTLDQGARTKFTAAVRRAIGATLPVERATAIEEATTLAANQEFAPQADCPVVTDLAEAAPGFEEGAARQVVLLLRHIECPEVSQMLFDCARGDWSARTGLLRSVALRVLGEGVRSRRLQTPSAFDGLVASSARAPNEIVRAAALEHLLLTSTEVSQRTALEAHIRATQPAMVLRLLAVTELDEPEQPDPDSPNGPDADHPNVPGVEDAP